MNYHLPSQYKIRKNFLSGIGIVLICIMCIYGSTVKYSAMKVELENIEQQFFLVQKHLNKTSSLRQQTRQQIQQLSHLDSSLLKGKSKDVARSTMQIQVQSMLTSSGLEPESLRPVTARESGNETIHSVLLKLRLSGSIEQFQKFLTTLYKADTFFHIEGLTIKPFKHNQLKIYMDLRSYYQTSTLPPTNPKGRK